MDTSVFHVCLEQIQQRNIFLGKEKICHVCGNVCRNQCETYGQSMVYDIPWDCMKSSKEFMREKYTPWGIRKWLQCIETSFAANIFVEMFVWIGYVLCPRTIMLWAMAKFMMLCHPNHVMKSMFSCILALANKLSAQFVEHTIFFVLVCMGLLYVARKAYFVFLGRFFVISRNLSIVHPFLHLLLSFPSSPKRFHLHRFSLDSFVTLDQQCHHISVL